MQDINIRRAQPEDADDIGKLLHDFNTEYDEPTPSPEQLAERFRSLLGQSHTEVLLANDEPIGVAVLRFVPSIWSEAQECYLAELYVIPSRRGQGIGRALMQEVLRTAKERGADYIYLGTSEDDTAARGLYEKFGFTNREGDGGPIMYIYEKEI